MVTITRIPRMMFSRRLMCCYPWQSGKPENGAFDQWKKQLFFTAQEVKKMNISKKRTFHLKKKKKIFHPPNGKQIKPHSLRAPTKHQGCFSQSQPLFLFAISSPNSL